MSNKETLSKFERDIVTLVIFFTIFSIVYVLYWHPFIAMNLTMVCLTILMLLISYIRGRYCIWFWVILSFILEIADVYIIQKNFIKLHWMEFIPFMYRPMQLITLIKTNSLPELSHFETFAHAFNAMTIFVIFKTTIELYFISKSPFGTTMPIIIANINISKEEDFRGKDNNMQNINDDEEILSREKSEK